MILQCLTMSFERFSVSKGHKKPALGPIGPIGLFIPSEKGRDGNVLIYDQRVEEMEDSFSLYSPSFPSPKSF